MKGNLITPFDATREPYYEKRYHTRRYQNNRRKNHEIKWGHKHSSAYFKLHQWWFWQREKDQRNKADNDRRQLKTRRGHG